MFYTLPFYTPEHLEQKIRFKKIQTSGLTTTTIAFREDIIVQRLPTYTYKHTSWGSTDPLSKWTTFNTQN